MSNRPFKVHELTIDIAAIREDNHHTGTTFFSYDQHSGKKIINFLTEGEVLDLSTLADLVIKIGFYYVNDESWVVLETVDGSIVIEDAEEGRCSVVLPNYLYSNWGPIEVYIVLTWREGERERSFDAGVIETEFEESWIDRELPLMEQFEIRRFNNLARDMMVRAEDIIEALTNFREASMQEFQAWFQLVRDTLGEDSAGNLFNMIWEHERKTFFTHEVHGGHILDGQLQFYIPGVGWVSFSQAFRATWEQRDAMGLTWEQRDAMGLTWIELDNMKGAVR